MKKRRFRKQIFFLSEVVSNGKNGRIVAYKCYNFPHIYRRILKGPQDKPVPGRFYLEPVDEGDKITPICGPRVKNAAFAEIVQWVWEKYYAHLQEPAAAEMSA